MTVFNKLFNPVRFFPISHMVALSLIIMLLALSFWVDSEKRSTTVDLIIPSAGPSHTEKIIEKITPQMQWQEFVVKSGDNLSLIFNRAQIADKILLSLLNSAPNKKQFLHLLPGEVFRFGFANQTLTAIEYHLDILNMIQITVIGEQFTFEEITHQPEKRLKFISVDIENSLFVSGAKAKIEENMIMQVANIFGGVIDFALDVKKGDNFDILFEEHYFNNEFIENGPILAASFTNNQKTYTAFRYTTAEGAIDYFDNKGNSMRKSFLRAPLDFTRISSNFNLKRKHPIHKKIKAHRGIDYAAPTGTPIFAAGDGKVIRSGYSRANGNYVIIQHGQQYITKYLHLQKRYVKRGQKVKQKQIIGTVGSTGFATGPHLHYEFLVNGVHRNPRTIINKLPSAKPIPADELSYFLTSIKSIKLQYENFKFQDYAGAH